MGLIQFAHCIIRKQYVLVLPPILVAQQIVDQNAQLTLIVRALWPVYVTDAKTHVQAPVDQMLNVT